MLYVMMIVIGLVTGALTGLMGSSGVMVVVPVLSMLFGVSMHTAIGTSLLVDVIASITVSFTYFKNKNIDLKAGMWIAISSVIGAQVGALCASNMGENNLGSSFAVVLILSGIGMMKKKPEGKKPLVEKIQERLNFDKEWKKTVASLVIGFGIGILSGIFGAGGGVMILIALIVILSFPLHKAIGTSTMIMTITAISSMTGYATRGNVDMKLGIFIGIGSAIGGIIASRYANKINEATLKKIVGIVFVVLGLVMCIMPMFSNS